MDIERSLLCFEEVIMDSPLSSRTAQASPSSSLSSSSSSPSSSPSLPLSCNVDCFWTSGGAGCGGGFFYSDRYNEDEDELSIAFLVSKQAQFHPSKGYATKLQARCCLLDARGNAVRWIVKVHFAFGFNPQTATLAVNYLDRYLEKSLLLTWKPWMVELVSIACLSLAAKMEEVDVPALLDLQGCVGLEHAFEAKTVQRMEVNVMAALQWRLSSITTFSFVEKAINNLSIAAVQKNTILVRCSELLLAILPEAEFLEFEPCLLGATSICFALEEALPVQADHLKCLLFQYIPLDTQKVRTCYARMEALIVDPICPTGGNSSDSPLGPSTWVYHIEDNSTSSVGTDTSRPYLASNFLIKRINLEELDCNPKRQRRH